MAWANLDDSFPSHPKVASLSDGAFRLHVAGICYCAKYLTNGRILIEIVPTLRPSFRPKMVQELVEKGLWIQSGDVYEIHDYLQWNVSREYVESERERKRMAGRKGAEKRWGNNG